MTEIDPKPWRVDVLENAFPVFAQYGYRKASMENIAEAVGVSRQSLYTEFGNKENLFREIAAHGLSVALEAASACLANDKDGLRDRLVCAFDEWVGRYVGVITGPHVDEIVAAGNRIAGDLCEAKSDEFMAVVADAIAAATDGRKLRGLGVSARDVATVLYVTAKGLKMNCESRDEFRDIMGAAIRLYCAAFTKE